MLMCNSTDFYARNWTDLGVVFGTDDLDQVIGREEIQKRLGDATLTQPLCANSAVERNRSLVPDGACYNATCPSYPRCQKHTVGPCYMGPKPCWNVDIYNMGTFRYESVYIGVPAFYHAVGPDHTNPLSPGTCMPGRSSH